VFPAVAATKLDFARYYESIADWILPHFVDRLDYLRNNRTNTSIAAYSTRARPEAPVSVTVAWTELARVPSPASFTMAGVPPAAWAVARGSLEAVLVDETAPAAPRRRSTGTHVNWFRVR
jgi:DNA primase